jgi:hypothetical protein
MKKFIIDVVTTRQYEERYEVEAEDEEDAEMKYNDHQSDHIPEYDKDDILSIEVNVEEE